MVCLRTREPKFRDQLNMSPLAGLHMVIPSLANHSRLHPSLQLELAYKTHASSAMCLLSYKPATFPRMNWVSRFYNHFSNGFSFQLYCLWMGSWKTMWLNCHLSNGWSFDDQAYFISFLFLWNDSLFIRKKVLLENAFFFQSFWKLAVLLIFKGKNCYKWEVFMDGLYTNTA